MVTDRKPQPLPSWAEIIAEKDAEIKRLRAALRMFACDCAVSDRCAVPGNCRNFQARRMLETKNDR